MYYVYILGVEKSQLSGLLERKGFSSIEWERTQLVDEEKMVVDDGRGNLVTTAFDLKHNSKKFPATPFEASNPPLCLPKTHSLANQKPKLSGLK